jgi:fumarate hydratase class II
MLVTLNTKIGYYKRPKLHKQHTELRLKKKQFVGYVSPEDFDNWVKPEEMV